MIKKFLDLFRPAPRAIVQPDDPQLIKLLVEYLAVIHKERAYADVLKARHEVATLQRQLRDAQTTNERLYDEVRRLTRENLALKNLPAPKPSLVPEARVDLSFAEGLKPIDLSKANIMDVRIAGNRSR